ncbi:MAG: GAF domain-containing sensor histidine kinase [Hyphomicrobiales bacterium]|nr:MAG: GAF domain-containing sensor histidine kinase [Hyphomicrobiales bacterium]
MDLTDDPADIARDVALVGRIQVVPSLLKIICQNTGMRFAAVARVTEGTWTACAVQDDIAFGLLPGGQLQVETTLCREARSARAPVAFDHASTDPVYSMHHTPRTYGIESYVSVPIIHPDGSYFGNLCAIDPSPHNVSNAQTLAMFKLFAEVIALQLTTEDRLQASYSDLSAERATSELREQFIAVLGHDLRNPLAAVAGTAELLRRRTAEPDLVKIGDRLRSTARRMSGLIDDVLDFARGRMGSGIGTDMSGIADPDSMLRDVVSELREAHPERVIRDEGIAIGTAVRGDRVRLQQLLSNFLGNAMAHGAADEPVVVEARIHQGDLHISVHNGGQPLCPEDLAKVFQPYWRPLSSKPGGGLGLGLYICQQIVQAHGGTLEVRSSLESGTVFTAKLPIVHTDI